MADASAKSCNDVHFRKGKCAISVLRVTFW